MTKISPHLWYTDKADEAAAFYAAKVEPGRHIGRLNVRARIDHRDRTPEPWIASCAMLWLSAVATIAETFGRRLRVAACSLTKCESAAGDHLAARANQRFRCLAVGSVAPARSAGPSRPGGCICGLGGAPPRTPGWASWPVDERAQRGRAEPGAYPARRLHARVRRPARAEVGRAGSEEHGVPFRKVEEFPGDLCRYTLVKLCTRVENHRCEAMDRPYADVNPGVDEGHKRIVALVGGLPLARGLVHDRFPVCAQTQPAGNGDEVVTNRLGYRAPGARNSPRSAAAFEKSLEQGVA